LVPLHEAPTLRVVSQTLPHPPQLDVDVVVDSQPSLFGATVALQSRRPEAHE
jgi:hypothetical protein